MGLIRLKTEKVWVNRLCWWLTFIQASAGSGSFGSIFLKLRPYSAIIGGVSRYSEE